MPKEYSKDGYDVIEGEECPVCGEEKLNLRETERDIPQFGQCFLFSMDCENCGYHQADVESVEEKDPCKYTFEITSEDDMGVRVVKSSSAVIKLPYLGSMEPGEASNGYVTNVEGILNRMKKQAEKIRDSAKDKSVRKKAKKRVKKLTDVMWGKREQKMVIEDKTGNSAIVSDKAEKEEL